MTKFKLKQSATVLNILIALVVTLVVNFSYLLSVMVEQRETSEQQKLRNERPFFVKPHRKGVLRISRDGYGYLICERHFSPEEGVDSVRTDSVYATTARSAGTISTTETRLSAPYSRRKATPTPSWTRFSCRTATR